MGIERGARGIQPHWIVDADKERLFGKRSWSASRALRVQVPCARIAILRGGGRVPFQPG